MILHGRNFQGWYYYKHGSGGPWGLTSDPQAARGPRNPMLLNDGFKNRLHLIYRSGEGQVFIPTTIPDDCPAHNRRLLPPGYVPSHIRYLLLQQAHARQCPGIKPQPVFESLLTCMEDKDKMNANLANFALAEPVTTNVWMLSNLRWWIALNMPETGKVHQAHEDIFERWRRRAIANPFSEIGVGALDTIEEALRRADDIAANWVAGFGGGPNPFLTI